MPIIPAHKTNEKSDTTNYRPVRKLQNLCKICELIYNQLYSYFDKILFLSQCVRKINSSQHCLPAILENFKKSVDDRKEFGSLLTNFSTPFDCIDHKILTAKIVS